jgi:hypothetical protein
LFLLFAKKTTVNTIEQCLRYILVALGDAYANVV